MLKLVFPGSFGVNIIEPSVSATILLVGYGSVNWEALSYSNRIDRNKLRRCELDRTACGSCVIVLAVSFCIYFT